VGALVVLAGCSDALRSDGGEISESAYTSDGGDAEASRESGADAGARAAIASFGLGDVGDAPKLKFAIDDGDVVTAIETSSASSSSVDRKLAMQGFSPVVGGKPGVYFEVGRAGARGIPVGTYDCAHSEGVVVVVPVGEKQMTVVRGGASRPCTIVIEDEKSDPVLSGAQGASLLFQRLVGRFEAVVGSRDDAASPTHVVRGVFAMKFSSQL
jgi:hypothetical protein